MFEFGDTKFAQFKIAVVQFLTLGIFLALATGFWRLQIQRPEYYAALAEQNRVKSLPILAPRGHTLDREGRVIVSSYPSFSILLLREQMKDHRDLQLIAAGLRIPLKELQARLLRFRTAASYEPVLIREDATSRDLGFLEAHRDDLPELEAVMVQRRLYPRDGFAAHVLGYVGEVSEDELNRAEFADCRPGAIVGQRGVERQYNDILMGKDGLRHILVNSIGREVGRLDETPAVGGQPLRLTLDLDLQVAAEVAMEDKKGALVALDPRTGEVLALVSRPVYDPNNFAIRISNQQWTRLTQDPDLPLLNRAIQAQLAPGSVYKIFLATAALEEEVLTEKTTFYCSGGAVFYGRYFRCWRKGGHGRMNLHRAIVQSCDVFFYNVGKRLGIEKIAYYSRRFGLGSPTGIDLPYEEEGVMPSPEWKRRLFGEKWYAGETISVAIGQGSVAMTPLQMAYGIGGIASGGVFRRPRLVFPSEIQRYRPSTNPDGPNPDGANPDGANPGVNQDEVWRFPLREETIEQVTLGMYGVVNERGGTGRRARIEGVEVGGKTGTAQLASLEATKGVRAPHLKDNAWFVGMAPRRNPEIVVVCLLEHGEHGYLAAPIVREVIKTYWDNRQPQKPRQLAAGQARTQSSLAP